MGESRTFKMKPTKEIEELKEEIKERQKQLKMGAYSCLGGHKERIEKQIFECETKLQTLQKANKQFAEVLGEEIENLESLSFICENCGSDEDYIGYDEFKERISHLKQLKKEYEEASK